MCTLSKNETLQITIDQLGNNGEGVGRINGYPIFIPGVLPGEKATVKIVKAKKHYAYGKRISVDETSDARVDPPCPYYEKCGGCQLQHMSYSSQLSWKTSKVLNDLQRIGKVVPQQSAPTLGMEYPFRYRNKAQFPVGKLQDGTPAIGFYAPLSHRLIPVEDCLLQDAMLKSFVQAILQWMSDASVAPYEEENHKGLVRHVLIRKGQVTGEFMICIVGNGSVVPAKQQLIEKLTRFPQVASIVWNVNTNKTNVILGNQDHLLWGKPTIQENIGDLTFSVSPHSFFQVNAKQTKILYETALSFANVKKTDLVLDLYCGVGTISLFFAPYVKHVIGVEIEPQAIEDAKKNAENNQISNVTFLAGAVETVIEKFKGEKFDVILVDPPRKGMDKKAIDVILQIQPEKIIYISCDSATLARDLALFCLEEQYQVQMVQPIDQFCMTKHVETCVLLSHKNS